MKKLLVFGSRYWDDRHLIRDAIEAEMPVDLLIHGGCRGADNLSGEVAIALGIPVLVFQASWNVCGKAAGPMRNQQMIDLGKPTHAICFHDDLASSRGSADMLRRLHHAGITVTMRSHKVPTQWVYKPDA